MNRTTKSHSMLTTEHLGPADFLLLFNSSNSSSGLFPALPHLCSQQDPLLSPGQA